MTKIKELISKERLQYLVFIGLSIGVIGLTEILYFLSNLIFQPFIGGINPLIASFIIVFLGIISLSFLLYNGWFGIYKKENLKGLFRRSALATLFVSITILIDLGVVFPANLNILFPQSLLFYPTMGFLVEILFHVLPLSLLLISLTSIFRNISDKRIIWICILIVSFLEPTYQMVFMGSSNYFPMWVTAIICLNLFLFNLSQLFIFKRFDFISMYSFRLLYYIIWHIVWGYMRLKLLF